MFTGLIKERGRVITPPPRIHIRCKLVTTLSQGDSVAVNGVCLTVSTITANGFMADVMPETLRRSTLRLLRPGSEVNLEPALTAADTLGGHLVTGHVDETGIIRAITQEKNAVLYTLSCSPGFLSLVAEKGSVAVDGISLTVTSLAPGGFIVSVIPHTRSITTLQGKRQGDAVNLECDPLARYARRHSRQSTEKPAGESLLNTLRINGFTGGTDEHPY